MRLYPRKFTLDAPEDKEEAAKFDRGDLPPNPARKADVQVAISIIGRRANRIRQRTAAEGWRLNLRNSNLIAYDFSGLNYDRTDFGNSFMNGADMSGASFENCLFRHVFFRGADMNKVSFRASIFDTCDFRDAKIESTDFDLATFKNADLRSARVQSLNIKGANLDEAFGSFFNYAVEDFKNNGPNSYNAQQVASLFELIQKASYDDSTSVSNAVSEAMRMMAASKYGPSGSET